MARYNSPLITILMPAYNPGPRIIYAVQSILNQTFSEWQLVILDDGSTDRSLNLIRDLNDPRIKIVAYKKNRGLSHRLNQGIDLAKGKYIARMDADDISFPSRLKKQFDFLEKHPNIDLLATRALAFKDKDFSLIGLLPFSPEHQSIVKAPWISIPMPHPTWMGKKKWFKKNKYKYPEVRRAEDQELLLRTYETSQFHCLSEILFAYRQGAINLRKLLLARKSLVIIQIRYFFFRRQWAFLFKAISIFILKVILDSVSVVPGMDFIFFSRMANRVPVGVKNQFKKIINHPKNRNNGN